MAKVFYNKLVRDKIEDIIVGKGERCEVRTIDSDEEFQQELLKKVVEEASALSMTRSKEEFLEEVTDLMIVLDTLNEFLQFDETTMQQAVLDNIARKGEYKNRHFLHWSDDKTYESNESPQGIKT
ncbi:nucleoside triphosphate pyrophosphohydrolase [Candidatus Kaiserbacteria bacterium]|nr:nucleoside triphosphate pyrophosphohydrolase [Candidatus Kaiserbacteria bacterium]